MKLNQRIELDSCDNDILPCASTRLKKNERKPVINSMKNIRISKTILLKAVLSKVEESINCFTWKKKRTGEMW